MAKYLIKTEETYRVDSEDEAKALIEAAKVDGAGDLVKYNCEYHDKKVKGEIVDTWYRVTLKRFFNDEKEPMVDVAVNYDSETISQVSFDI